MELAIRGSQKRNVIRSQPCQPTAGDDYEPEIDKAAYMVTVLVDFLKAGFCAIGRAAVMLVCSTWRAFRSTDDNQKQRNLRRKRQS